MSRVLPCRSIIPNTKRIEKQRVPKILFLPRLRPEPREFSAQADTRPGHGASLPGGERSRFQISSPRHRPARLSDATMNVA